MAQTEAMMIQYDTDRLQRRARNEGVFRALEKIYKPIPEVKCEKCGTVCCSASPEFYLVEYLHAFRFVRRDLNDAEVEARIVARALRWAFLNFFAEDIHCPFLMDGKCVIYPVRPLNCRLWALEDETFYQKKAERAAASLDRQQEYFAAHGLTPLKPLREYVLPKCNSITIFTDKPRYTEPEITAMDDAVLNLHRTLIRPTEFAAINLNLHFPGHVALKRIAPLRFDGLRIAVVREFVENGTETMLDEMIEVYRGKLP